MKSIFPIAQWLPHYGRQAAGHDLFAALIVTIMLVPQSLAYAMLAGLPPQVGLYASILPLFAYTVFGTSRTLAVGPVAVVSLMTAAAAGKFAAQGSAEYLQAAIALAFLSGLMLIAMAVFKFGFIANFLSHPVISGFISASGVLIAASQLKHVLGVKAEGENLWAIGQSLASHVAEANPYTMAVGFGTIALLFWIRKKLKHHLERIGISSAVAAAITRAGPVFAIATAILLVVFLDLGGRGVKLVGQIPVGFPPLALPSFDAKVWASLVPAAFLISIIGFVESVSVAQTLAVKRRMRVLPNQELVALGAANIASGLSGGFPVTGGFARSVVNDDAGAETPMAGAFTALGILAAALFLTPLFELLPQSVLAATIIVAVLSLVDIKAFRRNYLFSKADFAAMTATALLVLFVGVEIGIVSGVVLSLLLFLWRTSKPHVAIVGLVPGTEHFRNVERHAVVVDPHIVTLRVDESLYFANSNYLEDRIYAEVADNPALRHVVLMCPAVNSIDASALESLTAITERLNSTGIGFHLSEVKGPVMDTLKRSEFYKNFTGRIFLSQFVAFNTLKELAAPKPAPTAQAGHHG